MSSWTLAEVDRLISAATSPAPAAPAAAASAYLIYGAGGRGREIRRVLEARGHAVRGFVDRAAKAGQEIEGIPVWTPDDPAARKANAEGARVVVGIFRHDADVAEIVESLEGRGFTEVCTFLDVYRLYPDDFSTTYWLGPTAYIPPHADAIRRTFQSLGDDTSRRVFVEAMRMRVLGDVRVLRGPDRAAQYIPRDVVPLDRPMRFVDGGAFDGDTIRQLRAAKVDLAAAAAFEPDPVNFAALVKTAKSDPAEFALFPCGLWSGLTQLRFDANGSDGARIGGAGSVVIQCVALDDVLPSFAPTHLKLDVEGAEPEALDGARETIGKHRPVLAISAYHLPDHLWTLQQKIASWDLGYRFEMRHHGFLDFDIVLYALPA